MRSKYIAFALLLFPIYDGYSEPFSLSRDGEDIYLTVEPLPKEKFQWLPYSHVVNALIKETDDKLTYTIVHNAYRIFLEKTGKPEKVN